MLAHRARWAVFTFIAYALAIAGAWQAALFGGVIILVALLAYWVPAYKHQLRIPLQLVLLGLIVLLLTVAGWFGEPCLLRGNSDPLRTSLLII